VHLSLFWEQRKQKIKNQHCLDSTRSLLPYLPKIYPYTKAVNPAADFGHPTFLKKKKKKRKRKEKKRDI
jgi:hypothetical protein